VTSPLGVSFLPACSSFPTHLPPYIYKTAFSQKTKGNIEKSSDLEQLFLPRTEQEQFFSDQKPQMRFFARTTRVQIHFYCSSNVGKALVATLLGPNWLGLEMACRRLPWSEPWAQPLAQIVPKLIFLGH
jgi:hypothetical protein